MLFEDHYSTIAKAAEGVFKDKGSKFIAYAYPIASESDVKGLITNLKTEHGKARHFCWAFRISPDRSVFRLNDGGEPSGTAGRPILNSLLSAELTNILVVVVRYFGGTLLGVPGLINAYKMSTQDALNNALRIEKTVNDIYKISFPYLQMNDVMKVIKEDQVEVKSQKFDERCELQVEIRKSRLNQILSRFENLDEVETSYITTV